MSISSNNQVSKLPTNIISTISTVFLGIFIVGLALLLRLPLLNQSFWLDEAAQALEIIRPLSEQLDLAADFQPPLFHLLLHFWQFGGHQEWWLRLPSVVFSLASIFLIFFWSNRHQGKAESLVVGLFLSTSSLLIFYSQELRPYMMAVWWATLAWVLFWRWQIADQSQTKLREVFNLKSNLSLIFFSLTNALGALTSYVYLFIWPGWLIVTFLLWPKKWVPILKSLLVSLVIWLIWLPGLLKQLAASFALRQAVPDWERVVSLTQLKAIPLTWARFWTGILPVDLVLSDILIVILPNILIIYLIKNHWQSMSKSAKKQLVSLGLLISSTLLFAWLFSFWTPVVTPKRLLFLLPFLFLLISQLVGSFSRSAVSLIVIVLGVNLMGLGQYWQKPSLQRENWRRAVSDLEMNFQPTNSVVVFGFDAPFAPWVWYQREDLPTISTGFAPLASLTIAQKSLEGIEQYENVLVFDYLLDLSDPQRFIWQALTSRGFQLQEVFDYQQLGFIRWYRQPKIYAQQI